MAELSFAATIRRHGPGSWSYVNVPRSESAKFGTRARIPVRGTVNGVPVRTSLFPRGDGAFTMVVNATVRAAARADEGDTVKIRLTIDSQRRSIRTPSDLARTIRRSATARAAWRGLSFSHRKEYVDWLRATKNPGTRARRVRSALQRLAAGRALSD